MNNDCKKICDIELAVSNMGSSPALFEKHFNKFKDSAPGIISELETYIHCRNYSGASVLCHSIKGLSGILGFTSLQAHMQEAEIFFKKLSGENHGSGISDIADSESISMADLENRISDLQRAITSDIEAICRFKLPSL